MDYYDILDNILYFIYIYIFIDILYFIENSEYILKYRFMKLTNVFH
jgi:hypothetical protein